MSERASTSTVVGDDALRSLTTVGELQALVLAERASFAERIAVLEKERDALRASYELALQELALFKRRLFIAKAERIDTEQLRLEFEQQLKKVEELADTLGLPAPAATPTPAGDSAEPPPSPAEAEREPKAKDGKRIGERSHNCGSGRRDLRKYSLPEERVEIADPHMEKLVAEGKVLRHGFEDSHKLGRKRGGMYRLHIARVRYKAVDAAGNPDIINTPMPNELLPSALAAPSVVAHVITENIAKGMPLFRVEDSFRRDGIVLDRGTLARYKHTVGTRFEQTVVKAMTAHALATAFCISTDATGVCIQPINNEKSERQPCKKAHFLVQVADKDHILFEYLKRETSALVSRAFVGFEGFIQADAKNVFDVLYCSAEEVRINHPDLEPDDCTRIEVGCWFHLRRRFWEAAVAKHELGREGLARISRMFELDASWKKSPPAEIKRLRQLHLRPHVEAFFAWVDEQWPLFEPTRGYARTALGYARNQRPALMRFLDDGRLPMDNSRAERAIKAVALGRKAWLFCGSDDHAKSTAALYSIVASARLHGIEPEEYLRCLIRLVPLWPPDRMLELAPLFWARTRDRLDPKQLAADAGSITIPAQPLDTSTPTEQPSPR